MDFVITDAPDMAAYLCSRRNEGQIGIVTS